MKILLKLVLLLSGFIVFSLSPCVLAFTSQNSFLTTHTGSEYTLPADSRPSRGDNLIIAHRSTDRHLHHGREDDRFSRHPDRRHNPSRYYDLPRRSDFRHYHPNHRSNDWYRPRHYHRRWPYSYYWYPRNRKPHHYYGYWHHCRSKHWHRDCLWRYPSFDVHIDLRY